MKKINIVLASALCVMALTLTGCSSELSNDKVTITKYKGIEVPKQEVVEVTDEDVDARIDSILVQNSYAIEVTDRAAELGDTALIDFEGKKDGVAFDGGTASDFELRLGSQQFIEGFEEGIVGHNVGETFDLDLTFPEDYGEETLAGQPVVFTVTLKALTIQETPELTDDFVKTVSETATTVDEYKEEVKKSLQEDNKAMVEEGLKEAVWSEVVDNSEVKEYDEEEVKAKTDELYEQYEGMAQAYGMEFPEFLSSYLQMDEESFATEAEKVAKLQIKENLIAELLEEELNVDLSEKALEKKYEEYVERFHFDSVDQLKDQFSVDGNIDELEAIAKQEIVIEWLVDHCKQV